MIGRGPCNVSSEDTVVLAEASAEILLLGHNLGEPFLHALLTLFGQLQLDITPL